MAINTKGITWALAALKRKQAEYELCERYYDGNHPLQFATDKFRKAFGALFQKLSLNHCAIVVDTVADRLQPAGFEVIAGTGTNQQQEDALAEIWARNRMKSRSGEIHTEALKCGDAYAVVWPDADGVPVIYPNPARMMAVEYHAEQPGYIIRAAKHWVEKGRDGKDYVRLTLYYPDRLERYITKQPMGMLPDKAERFVELTETVDENGVVVAAESHIPNKYGRVPVFHFGNRRGIGETGRSELADIRAPQDALNKTVCDLLVSMEFNAFSQRWAVGIEVTVNPETGKPDPPFTAGVDRVWSVANPDAKFGEFLAGQVEPFVTVKSAFRQDIAVISGIPVHYFELSSGNVPSGESLKTLEQRLTAKVQRLQHSWGETWADLMRFALLIQGGAADTRLDTNWVNTMPRSENDDISNAAKKRALGVSRSQVLKELDYTEAQIAEFDEAEVRPVSVGDKTALAVALKTITDAGASIEAAASFLQMDAGSAKALAAVDTVNTQP